MKSIYTLLAKIKVLSVALIAGSLLLPVSAFAWGYGGGYSSQSYGSSWGSGYGNYNYSYGNSYRSTPTYASTPSSGYTCANQSSQFECDYNYTYNISYFGGQMAATPTYSYPSSYGSYGGNRYSYSRGYNRGW